MLTKSDIELRRKTSEHRKNSLTLLAAAQKIQQEARQPPLAERLAAMDEVIALQMEALSESRQTLSLEMELIARQRAEIRRQKWQYLDTGEVFPLRN